MRNQPGSGTRRTHMTRAARCIGGLAGCALLAAGSPAAAQPAISPAPVQEVGQPAPPAPLGAGPTAFQRFRFAARPLGGVPVGDFGDRVGTSPGLGLDFTGRIGRTPVAVGAELGYLQYGKETRRLSLTPAVPEVLTDVNTTNHFLQTHALVRVQPQTGRVRPYVEGLVGFRYVFTRTSFRNADEGRSGSTLLGDLAPSAGAGGGVAVGLVSGSEATLNLDIGLRYFTGGDVEYLTKGAVVRHEDAVTLETTRSPIDLVSLHIGMAVDF